MSCVGLPDLIVALCNGSRATECGRPSWATTALLRLSHVLKPLQRPRTMYRPSAFDFSRSVSSAMLIVTTPYTQEHLLLTSPTSTFCNCHFCDALVAYCRDQSHIFTLFMLSARDFSTPSWQLVLFLLSFPRAARGYSSSHSVCGHSCSFRRASPLSTCCVWIGRCCFGVCVPALPCEALAPRNPACTIHVVRPCFQGLQADVCTSFTSIVFRGRVLPWRTLGCVGHFPVGCFAS